MKQRFSSLDVCVIAHELSNTLPTLRLANIYDLSSRIFLLKFAKPNHREQLVLDSGFRCHLTSFTRSTAAAPSPFVARLRKFLRTRRVTSVSQIGTDRVIEIQFSQGQYRLFLEFYAGGNVVLTDGDLTIIALLRNVHEGAENEQYRLGLKYDLTKRQNYDGVPELTVERLRRGLQRVLDRQDQLKEKGGKKIKKKKGDDLRKALAVTTTEFPPVLIDHALYVGRYGRDVLPKDVVVSEELLEKLLECLKEAQRVVRDITSAESAKGYILAKKSKSSNEQEGEGQSNLVYDDFHPFKPAHLVSDESTTFIECEGFNKTVDRFFSSLEGQRLQGRLQELEDNAKRRIEAAKQEQAKRIDGLQQVQDANERKAQAIEANVERVEEAIAAMNDLISQRSDWADIAAVIEQQQARRNAVAELIQLPLKLYANVVTLLLPEHDAIREDDDLADETDSEASDSDSDDEPKPSPPNKPLVVDIDLGKSPWANARHYYDQRRSAAVKQEKTSQAAQKAIKNTEKKVLADLKKGTKQEKQVLRPARKPMWFEKFIFFISSDGYLIIAGRDVQQDELLYHRHLRKGDVYVHADLQGAASVIIKNNPHTPDAPIPPSTLSQAGNLAVCTSSAWESKAAMSAWWVNFDQVSKTAPTGEYLSLGNFVISGKKNYLPPAQLLLGFAALFRISEESKQRHLRHRLGEGNADSREIADEKTAEEAHADDNGDEGEGEHGDAEAFHEQTDVDDARSDVSEDHLRVESEDEDEKRQNPLMPPSQTAEDGSDSDADEGTEAPPLESPTSKNAAENEDVDSQPTRQTSARERKEHRRAQAEASARGKKGPQVRGKKGKAKKIAQKYADQDEEDRELAMKLLGSKAAEGKREAEAALKAAKAKSLEEAAARRRAQHEKTQKEGLAAEQLRRLKLEGDTTMDDDDDDEEAEQSAPLDCLVGTLLPGDEVLEVIPLCAPWTALGKYKYKAKMQPGQQKKGKAVREILGKWTADASDGKKIDSTSQDAERIWPKEAELLKTMKEAEVVGVVPVKQVKVMMGGGDKAKGGGRGKPGRGRGKRR
ncbi:hypothetical protein K470DRAFT_278168 [Piedraia hortae CBS 480.64]|uniref:Ribosome quality control complex subunit 2 n=1 Tax=Piedraia hortae CBS 480.64 TaxID=1314780 RepID=A0A6A7BUL0_9PEZI|nr:hypothetical protein K470DRAFT_278168 [Piedraia hortae CBS 480.64]